MAIDVDSLWNYDQPAESEQRFRAALAHAAGDDALILRTQIARTFSLRKRFDAAHAELDAVATDIASASAEPRVRARLERGRTLRSSGKSAEARPLVLEAFEIADAARLEYLAADALHMIPLVEAAIEGQIDWTRRFVNFARAATDPKARAWEAPGLNNLGCVLNDAGRHNEALAAFREALALREKLGQPVAIRIARWMIAHTLRRLGRIDDALALQLELAGALEAAGEVDPYVFEELALLYDAKGDANEAARHRESRRAATAD